MLSSPPVVAGVYLGQSSAVVLEAAGLASDLGAELVCAYVNPGRYIVEESADGAVVSAPIDPDFDDTDDSVFPKKLAHALERQLARFDINWRTLLLAGDVAEALERCAKTLDARFIVVGTHGDARTPVRELFKHSVATRLVRRQHKTTVVVPTHHIDRARTQPRPDHL